MTLQDALKAMRDVAGRNVYVAIDMTAQLHRFSSTPSIEWTAWRGDTQRVYKGDTFEQAATKAIKDQP